MLICCVLAAPGSRVATFFYWIQYEGLGPETGPRPTCVRGCTLERHFGITEWCSCSSSSRSCSHHRRRSSSSSSCSSRSSHSRSSNMLSRRLPVITRRSWSSNCSTTLHIPSTVTRSCSNCSSSCSSSVNISCSCSSNMLSRRLPVITRRSWSSNCSTMSLVPSTVTLSSAADWNASTSRTIESLWPRESYPPQTSASRYPQLVPRPPAPATWSSWYHSISCYCLDNQSIKT